MFRQAVDLIPPFTRDMAANMGTVAGINNDRTLFMTATALLYNRVENLKLNTQYFTSMSRITDVDNDPNVYSIFYFEHGSNPDEYLESVKDKFENIESLETIEKFVKDKFDQTVYIRTMPNENTVCLFVQSLNYDIIHLLQSFFSKYFKVFKDKKLTEDEIEFVRTLTLRTPGNYSEKIQKLVDNDTFRRFSLNFQLTGFEARLYKKKLEEAQKAVASFERTMADLMLRYRECVKDHMEAKIRYEGLSVMTSSIEEKTELQDYLINNKNLSYITIEDSHIRFLVKGFLIPYNIEDWENQSAKGYILSGYGGEFADKDNTKLFLDAIFGEKHSLKLRLCAYVDMDYVYSDVNHRTFNYETVKDCIPNPHLKRHNCFGQNKPDIIQQLTTGDVIGAIECMTHAVKHINVNEVGMTFKPFLDELTRCNTKCIVTEDGQEMTPVEALHYLKEKNKNESNSAE